MIAKIVCSRLATAALRLALAVFRAGNHRLGHGVYFSNKGCTQVIRAMFALATTEAPNQSEALRVTLFRTETFLNRGSPVRLWQT